MVDHAKMKACIACRRQKPIVEMRKVKSSNSWICNPCHEFREKLKRMTPTERDRYLDSLRKP